MSLEEEVVKIGKQLEKIVAGDVEEDDSALDLLTKLKDLPITLDVLTKTRIGMSVNSLRKNSGNENIQSISKTLIKSWKKLLASDKGDKSSSKSTSKGDSRPPSTTSSKDAATPSISRSSSTSSLGSEVAFPPRSGNDDVREKCRDMLVKALLVDDADADVTDIAAQIEICIFNEFRNTDQKYKARIRSRVANLRDKKNPGLRQKVIAGEIEPSRVATMTAEEMASDDMKKLRQELTKEAIRDAQMATNPGTKTALFKCNKCTKRNCTYTQLQTRSADEPMTTFVFCLECGNRWKFC